MPELPEVHTIVTDLNQNITGFTVKNVTVNGSYRVLPNKKAFTHDVTDAKIIKVFRIAKNICFDLSSHRFLLLHLGMTGSTLLCSPKEKSGKWDRVVFKLQKNGSTKQLILKDVRKFGKVEVLDAAALENLKNRYGPDPLSPTFTAQKFWEILQSKRTAIKNVLLDQKIISGLGNIYATDALFLAKIHPQTPSNTINRKLSEDLLKSIRAVLKEGIKRRGSSLRDYVDALGQKGTQQDHFKIYNQKICPKCHGKTAKIKLGGRGTYFCPKCQPK